MFTQKQWNEFNNNEKKMKKGSQYRIVLGLLFYECVSLVIFVAKGWKDLTCSHLLSPKTD